MRKLTRIENIQLDIKVITQLVQRQLVQNHFYLLVVVLLLGF